MKLIFCKNCCHLLQLSKDHQECHCGKSYGRYLTDGLKAMISDNPECIPIGIDNRSFTIAIKNASGDYNYDYGDEFTAFAIVKSDNIIRTNYKK